MFVSYFGSNHAKFPGLPVLRTADKIGRVLRCSAGRKSRVLRGALPWTFVGPRPTRRPTPRMLSPSYVGPVLRRARTTLSPSYGPALPSYRPTCAHTGRGWRPRVGGMGRPSNIVSWSKLVRRLLVRVKRPVRLDSKSDQGGLRSQTDAATGLRTFCT